MLEITTKACSTCKVEKPSKDFIKFARNKSGLHSQCTPCRNATATKSKEASKAIILAAKAIPCADCGVQYHSCAMDFHHRDPSKKEYHMGRAIGRRAEVVLKEIAKCDVLCSNCHRMRHFNERRDG